jgi:uncharacterized protein (DUF1499 family)
MAIMAENDPVKRATPPKYSGAYILFFACLAGFIAIAGSYGAGFGLWHFQFGLLALAISLLVGVMVVIVGFVNIARGKMRLIGKGGIGIIIALSLVGVIGYWARAGFTAPPIHDVSTSLDAPPAFEKLKLRADNMEGVESVARWQKLHRGAYGDIQPVLLDKTPAQAMTIVRKAVAQRGWDVAVSTPERIEATDTVSPFKFKDDVVIVVAPTPAGGAEINMRSVSRVGLSDLGVNAGRVRALIKDITSAAGEE